MPRRLSSRERLRRHLDRLAAIQPVDDAVAATRIVLAVELSRTLIALDAAEPLVTEHTFHDAYHPPKPRDRRAEIEQQIYALQARKFDNTTSAERDEIDGAIAALRHQLLTLPNGNGRPS